MSALGAAWTFAGSAPGQVAAPEALDAAGLDWRAAPVPGTVAQALALPLAGHPDLDAQDWWYRGRFHAAPGRARLRFEGLATLVEVWLDGRPLLQGRNMFRSHEVELELGGEHELVLAFRALAPELAARRPRPRWKTALVEAQNLRWVRTSLLGRIPGWTPRVAPVGPWRDITLRPADALHPSQVRLTPRVEGGVARLGVRVQLPAHELVGAGLWLGDTRHPLPPEVGADGAQLEVGEVPRWWPHTAGAPARLPVRLELADGRALALPPVGFRELRVDRSGGAVRLQLNGRPHFCRGACWTVAELRALDGDGAALRQTLETARDLGMDTVRVGGTMTWGSAAFYALCDELGLLVWQDLMFANMDYPFGDAAFRAEVDAELDEQLARLGAHACVVVVCGGSEIEQQAAMLGLPASEWSGPFFAQDAPARVAQAVPGAAWFPSTPTGGALPFHTGEGLTHYYGVGAYLRPLGDVRRAQVRFTPECLGFANVPDEAALEGVVEGAALAPHHPAWKAGVPRDNGAGWDFEDVRDHYLRERFSVDPVALRSRDLPRYLALSRVVTGELMRRVYAEWRRPGSPTGGALVWFLRDLRPGAGWGILDHRGQPKPAAWALKRAWARRAVLLTDEGLDGLALHVHNEHDEPLRGVVQLDLLRASGARVDQAEAAVTVAPWSALTLSGDAMIGHFTDLAYAYRFGPPKHDVVVARLCVDGEWVHDDALFPQPGALPLQPPSTLAATVAPAGDGLRVRLESTAFLHALSLTAAGWTPDDDAFDLSPGHARQVHFRPTAAGRPFKLHIGALNLDGWVTLRA